MTEPTVAAGLARGLLELASRKGADRSVLLARAGLEAEDLADPDRRLPLSSYVALMRAAQELCEDPALALHFGEAFDMAELSILGLVGPEPSGRPLPELNRYSSLVVDVDAADGGDRFIVSRRGGELWIIDARSNPDEFPEMTESTFVRMATGARKRGGAAIIKAVHVTHPRPTYWAEYDRIFRAPVIFESDKNALILNETTLETGSPSANPYVAELLTQRAEILLETVLSSRTIRGEVERRLRADLSTGDIGIKKIARRLGFSSQTLSRRLKAEGTTFKAVLDELRKKLALESLRFSSLTIEQTAHRVGFSDTTAFSRAVKRWTGATPRELRSAKHP
jgi:AraC-like DNA-binding protein